MTFWTFADAHPLFTAFLIWIILSGLEDVIIAWKGKQRDRGEEP